jgi:hypothetical protein
LGKAHKTNLITGPGAQIGPLHLLGLSIKESSGIMLFSQDVASPPHMPQSAGVAGFWEAHELSRADIRH